MSKKITKRGRYMMKVLMLNGSPRTKGNTFIALEEMKKVFEVEGVEAEIVQVGNKDGLNEKVTSTVYCCR